MAALAPHVKAGLLCLDAWMENAHKARTVEEMAAQVLRLVSAARGRGSTLYKRVLCPSIKRSTYC